MFGRKFESEASELAAVEVAGLGSGQRGWDLGCFGSLCDLDPGYHDRLESRQDRDNGHQDRNSTLLSRDSIHYRDNEEFLQEDSACADAPRNTVCWIPPTIGQQIGDDAFVIHSKT